MAFDPSKPFELIDAPPSFDPEKPFEIIKAPKFDESKPFELVQEKQPLEDYDAIPSPKPPLGTFTGNGDNPLTSMKDAFGAVLTGAGNVSRAIPADIAASVAGSEFSGNIPAALTGKPLPVDAALKDASDAGATGYATMGKISQGLAATAPLLAAGALPTWAQKLVALGFSAQMIMGSGESAKALGEEMGKNPDERDKDKLTTALSDLIQEVAFAPLAAKHGSVDVIESRVRPKDFLVRKISEQLKNEPLSNNSAAGNAEMFRKDQPQQFAEPIILTDPANESTTINSTPIDSKLTLSEEPTARAADETATAPAVAESEARAPISENTIEKDAAREQEITQRLFEITKEVGPMDAYDHPEYLPLQKEMEVIKNRYQGQKPSDVLKEPEKESAGEAPPFDWDLLRENLASNLDSFSPARHTGRIDYELNEVANRFVNFAQSQPTRPLKELVKEFALSDDASPSQIKKLKAAIKDLPEEKGVTQKVTEIPKVETPAKQGDVVSIFHGATKEAIEAINKNGFDVNKSADGSIWFTDNKSKIEGGEVAASGKGGIVEKHIDESKLKLGGWNETDKYSTDELISMGYDGLKLPGEGETTYQIFNPEKLTTPVKTENVQIGKPALTPSVVEKSLPTKVNDRAAMFNEIMLANAHEIPSVNELLLENANMPDPGKTGLNKMAIQGGIARTRAIKSIQKQVAKELGLDPEQIGKTSYRAEHLDKLIALVDEIKRLEVEADDPGKYPPDVSTPKLRKNEYGTGELLQGADAPFNLAGEKATDFERIAADKAKAERNAAEAKAIQDKQQQELPGSEMNYEQKAARIADALESLFKSEGTGKLRTLPIDVILEGAAKVAANIIRRGGKLADAIAAGIKHVRDNHQGFFDEADFEKKITSVYDRVMNPPERGNSATGLTEEITNRERKERGLEPVEKDEPVSNEATLAVGRETLAKNPARAREIMEKLRTADVSDRTISRNDAAVLLAEKRRMVNERNRAGDVVNDSNSTPEQKTVARMDWDRLEVEIAEMDQAAQDARSVWGGFGQFWQRTLKEDFSFENMERKARMSKDGPWTKEDSDRLHEQADAYAKHAEAEEKIQSEIDQAMAESEKKAEHQDVIEIVAKERQTPGYSPQILEQARRIVERYKKDADSAMNRLLSKTRAGFSPEDIRDIAIVMRGNLAEAALSFAEMSIRIKEKLGKEVSPYLEKAWELANKMHDEGATEPVKRAMRKQKPEGSRDNVAEQTSIVERMKEKISENKGSESLKANVRKLRESLQREAGGKLDRHQETTAVHEALKEVLPDITREQTEKLMTGYGDLKPLTKDQIKLKIQENSTEIRETLKMRSSLAGEPQAGSSFVRKSPEAEARRLAKLSKDYQKRYGPVEATDPATQLKTALASKETRLENRIEELKDEIAAGKRTVREKGPSPENENTLRLKAELDAVEKEHKAIFGDRKMSDEQKLKMALESAKKSEAEWSKRAQDAKAGRFTNPVTGQRLTNEEINAIRAQRDAHQATVKELHDLQESVIAEKEAAKLEAEKKSIEKDIADRMAGKESSGSQINRPHLDPQVEALLQMRDDLIRQQAEARKKPADVKAAEDRQKKLDKINASIDEKLGKVASGDISTKTKPPSVPDAELDNARAQLKAVNDQLADLRRMAKSKSPEEIAFNRRVTQLQNQAAKYAEQLAKRDYGKKPTKSKPAWTPEQDSKLIEEQIKKEDAKLAMEQDRAKWEFERLSKAGLAWYGVKQVVGAQQGLKSAYDFSAFRQLAPHVFELAGDIPFALARSARGIEKLGDSPQANLLRASRKGWQSIKTEGQFRAHDQALKNRQNYKDGTYKKSGLQIMDMVQSGETVQTHWGDKIPGVRRSNRGFTMLINETRANAFDALWDAALDKSPENAKAIADLVNKQTGTVNLAPGKVANAIRAASAVIWTPKMLISRFNQIRLAGIWAGPKEARKMAGMQYLKMAVGVGALYGLAQLAGLKRDKKGKLLDADGNHIDPFGGTLQAGNFLKDAAVNAARGEVNSRQMLRFARSKMRPGWGILADEFNRRTVDPFGKPLKNPDTWSNTPFGRDFLGRRKTGWMMAEELFTPMSWTPSEILKSIEANGIPKATALKAGELLGASVNNYPEDKPVR